MVESTIQEKMAAKTGRKILAEVMLLNVLCALFNSLSFSQVYLIIML